MKFSLAQLAALFCCEQYPIDGRKWNPEHNACIMHVRASSINAPNYSRRDENEIQRVHRYGATSEADHTTTHNVNYIWHCFCSVRFSSFFFGSFRTAKMRNNKTTSW